MKEYLDFNATTPVSTKTAEIMQKFLVEDFGNAGSRTHQTGSTAKQSVIRARTEIAEIFDADFSELIFTSGATESNNIAILGLIDFAQKNNKKHIITSQIEHKAVLDPMKVMESSGFEVCYVKPNSKGFIDKDSILNEIREDTFLISLMHANNETGVINNINDIFSAAKDINSELICHSDASQTFAKSGLDFTDKSVDMFSISSHKFYGPKGIGALLTRKQDGLSLPLKPIMFGGGQEKGLRPGTLPVHLIVGMWHAAITSHSNSSNWTKRCLEIKNKAISAFKDLECTIYGDIDHSLPNTLSISFSDIHAEAIIMCLKEIAELSTGSACTSESYSPSHVLMSMGLKENEALRVVRFSWGPDTNEEIWDRINNKIETLI